MSINLDEAGHALFPSSKRNLIIVRAGKGSFHEGWLVDRADRNWDIAVSRHDEMAPSEGVEFTSDDKAGKVPALNSFIKNNRELLNRYDYICFADDDLRASAVTWNCLFDICAEYGLELAQPALTCDSYLGHKFTIQDGRSLLRFTNFVEMMCPIFSRAALGVCYQTFSYESEFYWGHDFVWPHLLGNPRDRMAIIDAFPVTHMRPASHNTNREAAFAEMHAMLAAFGVDGMSQIVYDTIPLAREWHRLKALLPKTSRPARSSYLGPDHADPEWFIPKWEFTT